ncbi:PDZ domain-containing protein [uncultured Secundilactobacillus sp.]|uniref:PDZ domain-containing protein n=1 Tax=uncultured Secundilactobacillus sp. TaxID=2813935 RepID=UPI002584FCE7|nr:PDZ domain-containing protein [uncultured Secundilactobacillus sp.]
MTIGLLFASLVLQPVWWMGLIREWRTSNHRIRAERRTFGSAVYQDQYELRHYLSQSLVLGVLASLLSILVGVTVPITWWIMYTVLALLGMMALPAGGPLIVLVISIAGYFANQVYGFWQPDETTLTQLGFSDWLPANPNFVAVATIALLLVSTWLYRIGGRYNAPQVLTKQRGQKVAEYRFNELAVIPMLVLVPGDWFVSHTSFWPTLMVGQHRMTLLFLPLVIGLRWTILKQVPRVALVQLARKVLVLGIVGLVLTVISRFVPVSTPWLLGGLVIGYGLVLGSERLRDQHRDFWFSDVNRGVRVIGIQPRTPAAKMALNIGDIILECNHVPVNNEDDFYRALLQDATYCHLRIQEPDGELKVSETAIFANAPHEIGVVLFQQ